MDSATRRYTKEELGVLSFKELKEALGQEGLPTGNAAKATLVNRYLGVKKEKKKPMSAAERKRKQRAKQSEDDRLEENKRRRDKRAENPEMKTRQNTRNARLMEVARSDPECRRRENSREKHRRRMLRGPPGKHRNSVPWDVLNEAGKSAHHRKSLEERDALWDEADAITKKYHERRLMAMGPIERQSLGYNCVQIPGRIQIPDHLDYDVQAVVEGAGASEVNGRYRWVRLGTYERSAMHNGEKVVFTLFSRKHHFKDSVEGDVLWCTFCWWHISCRTNKRTTKLYERPPPLWNRYQLWRTRTRTKIDKAKPKCLSQEEIKKIKQKHRQLLGGCNYNPQPVSNTQPPPEGWVCSCDGDGVQPPPKVELVVARPNGQPLTFRKMETLAETKQSAAQTQETEAQKASHLSSH